MATSGSIDSGGYSGRHLQFSWNTQSVSIENNIRTISYSITAVGGSARYYYHHNNTVSINGINVYTGGDSDKVYNNTILKSDTFTINQNDTLNLTVEMHGGIYTSSDNINTTQTFPLDELPRYLNSINLYDNGSSLNSISARWTCDPARDWTQYSLNGGAWTDAGDSVASDNKSGYFTINNLNPNTEYSLKIKLKRTDSQLWSESNTINIRTLNAAIITNLSDNFVINSDNSLTVTCNNPSNNDIAYFIDCPLGTQRLRSERTKNTSYTWTQVQILSMLQYFTNSSSSSLRVGVITYGNSDYYNYQDGTLRATNSNPIFSDFDYEDINATTLALTGNNQILIKGHSDTKVTITTANKATAQNYATMDRYELIQGTKNAMASYSSNNDVTLTANNVDNNSIIVSAIDSRGNSTSIMKTLIANNYKEYISPTILSVIATRSNNGVGKTVNLTFNGTFWNNNFGDVDNDIITANYKYKETNSNTWSQENWLYITKSGNTYSGNQNISGDLGAEGFSIEKAFNIMLIIQDKLETRTYEVSIGYGEPAIAIYKGNVAIGQKYDTTLGGRFQINGIGYINGIKIQPEIISATIDRKSLTISQAWDIINLPPFDSYISTTNKITVTNTGLKIGSNVSKILVSAHCRGLDCAIFTGQNIFSVRKNNVVITEDYISSANGWHPFNITPLLINCTENDVISIYFTSSIAGTGDALEEYLTIQIIE